jgi:succinyl-CoA synthetase beta subunit
MRLLEDDLKPILQSHGAVVPIGGRYTPGTLEELVAPMTSAGLVVKVLSAHNDRYQRGEIELVTPVDLPSAVARLGAGGAPLWIEEQVAHDLEFFLGVVWSGDQARPTALFSTSGGSGVVDRAATMRQEVIAEDAAVADVASRLVAGHPELVGTAEVLLSVFEELDALALELNPVVLDERGVATVLDAKGYLDPYGRGPALLAGPEAVETDAAPAEYVALDGLVGVVSIGAGLTRAVIDWLSIAGPGAACFSDLIGPVLADASLLLAESTGPTCVAASRSIAQRLAERGVHSILVCLVSGGTPTDMLSQSVIAGLSEWPGPIVSFVAGNRSEAARAVWRSAGFVSPDTLGEAIAAVCASVR